MSIHLSRLVLCVVQQVGARSRQRCSVCGERRDELRLLLSSWASEFGSRVENLGDVGASEVLLFESFAATY
eukprot:3375805-Pyramimonas_sp.AAC.1